jgi:hypothetical protein
VRLLSAQSKVAVAGNPLTTMEAVINMDLPDVNCWIKLVTPVTGKEIHGEGIIDDDYQKIVVRYVIANDSHLPAGPLMVVGALYKDGVKIGSNGDPNVVPAQINTLQPNTIWKKEWTIVTDSASFGQYKASILADVGNFVNEEEEANNKAQRSFAINNIPD